MKELIQKFKHDKLDPIFYIIEEAICKIYEHCNGQAKLCNDYIELIENGLHETKEGMSLRNKLVTYYGEHHPVILDFNRLIRWQTFKRRKSQNSK